MLGRCLIERKKSLRYSPHSDVSLLISTRDVIGCEGRGHTNGYQDQEATDYLRLLAVLKDAALLPQLHHL